MNSDHVKFELKLYMAANRNLIHSYHTSPCYLSLISICLCSVLFFFPHVGLYNEAMQETDESLQKPSEPDYILLLPEQCKKISFLCIYQFFLNRSTVICAIGSLYTLHRTPVYEHCHKNVLFFAKLLYLIPGIIYPSSFASKYK